MPTPSKPPSPRLTLRDDVDLEPLDDLPLTGFDLPNDVTPTSATTSLPTPGVDAFQHSQSLPMLERLGFKEPDDWIEMPGAPLLKDYDTFTEGTAKGSFDSIPIGSTDQFGEHFPILDTPTVEALPTADVSRSIERWRDNVSQSLPDPTENLTHEYEYCFDDDDFYVAATPTKRPRSITSDDGARRMRPRPHSMVASMTQSQSAPCISHDAIFATPMLTDMPGPSRPRAQSAPPNKGGDPPS